MKGKQYEKGQGLVEFAIILCLVAIAVVVVLTQFGPAIGSMYCQVSKNLSPSACNMTGGGVAISSDGHGNLVVSCGAPYTLSIDGTNPGGSTQNLGTQSCNSGSDINFPLSGHHGWTITFTDVATGHLMATYGVP